MTSTAQTNIPADTLERQRRASDPATSAWVSANAGSGKTHVLAQRVLRLLLAGVAPGRILCLTFTKAAAANMSIRVFRHLAAWTRLDDAALAAAIVATGAPPPRADLGELEAARRLFARTVETPGGLKIQTIHAFCERLLHLFPFEANVPARFEVIEDRQSDDLLHRAREAVLAESLRDPGSDFGRARTILSGLVSGQVFEERVREALGHRGALRGAMAQARDLDGLLARLGRALGLAPDDTDRTIAAEMTAGELAPASWRETALRIGADGGSDRKAGNRLMNAAEAPEPAKGEAYLSVFLTEKREPRSLTYLPATLRRAEPALSALLDRERERLAALVERRKAVAAAERSAALVVVAAAILDRYDAAKRRRGLLDFDDLVERTASLLATSSSAWVLYKLDRGIDHVLVDEAQDTSPDQWEILKAVTDDFFAGHGRPAQNRTVFAVGDEKQSIYSFQGARPEAFAAMHRHFAERVTAARRRFAGVELLLSFRSAPAILRAVDGVFAVPAHARGLVHDVAGPQRHTALRAVPGRVELWPIVRAVPQAEPSDWRLPVDVVEAGDPPVVLARRIADAIRRMIDPASGETVADENGRRAVRPGDVMVLVRSRNAVFEATIRALKERQVPVAGADRLLLTQHIAVMDLVAAGRAALSPADDFTLACVLKSPLIGLDDDDLIALAPRRRGTLVAALRASTDPRHAEAHARIAAWRERSAWLTPFAFYTRLLGADGGRRDLLARLGPEAADAIDEFVALALAHERNGAASLMAFLARLDGAEVEIKRDLEAAGDAVRVMTVHAAKGLEAKIVVLPDTCGVPDGRHDPALFLLGDRSGATGRGALAWSPRVDADPPVVAASRAAARDAAVEEHNRLLYVAMTRAGERLVVAGFCGERGPPDGSWYAMVAGSDLPFESVPAPWDPAETILRLEDPADGAAIATPSASRPAPEAFDAPAWLFVPPARDEAPAVPPVRPSNPLGAADQVPGEGWPFLERRTAAGRRDAATAGRLMHRLLQHLPAVAPERRAAAARRFLSAQGSALPAERRAALADRALALIDDPALGALFGPASRAEVAVSATIALPGGRTIEVAGQIDRIAVSDGRIDIADFKTGTPGPLAPNHLRQLALYAAAVAPLYPDREIRTALVWTATGEVIAVSAEARAAALAGLG